MWDFLKTLFGRLFMTDVSQPVWVYGNRPGHLCSVDKCYERSVWRDLCEVHLREHLIANPETLVDAVMLLLEKLNPGHKIHRPIERVPRPLHWPKDG